MSHCFRRRCLVFLSSVDIFYHLHDVRPTAAVRRSTMASSSSGSPRKHEPYFYTIFQAFCSGPRANAKPGANRNGRQRPIAEQVKTEADSLVRWINRFLIEDLKKLTVLTSVIPSAFFPEHDPLFLQHYLIDRPIYTMMVRGEIINWITSFRQLFPIRTSGKRSSSTLIEDCHFCCLTRKWKLPSACRPYCHGGHP